MPPARINGGAGQVTGCPKESVVRRRMRPVNPPGRPLWVAARRAVRPLVPLVAPRRFSGAVRCRHARRTIWQRIARRTPFRGGAAGHVSPTCVFRSTGVNHCTVFAVQMAACAVPAAVLNIPQDLWPPNQGRLRFLSGG